MLVVVNFILQLLSGIIGLLNSNSRPLYSLILVSLSFASFVLWIIELVHRGKRETVTWKWRVKLIPLLYSSSTNKSFFRGADIVGLPSALFTFIITVVNFDLLVRHANTQIQITLWPIVAATFLLCSKFWADRTNKDAADLVPLRSIIIDSTGSEYQKSSTILLAVKAYICWGCVWCSQITIERGFAIVNFILEIPSALLDQLSSEPKSQYALILMLLSLCSSILCILELWYKGKTERVTWSWKWIIGKVPWPYPNKPFFSFWNKVGLTSAVVQLILATVNYVFVVQHIGQVTICVFPIVFGLVGSFPKIYDGQHKTEGDGNVDEEDEVALINQTQTESEEEKSVLIKNQSHRMNQEEHPKAEGSVVQYDKTTHSNLRQRARKASVPKEIEEPSWVNGAKRCSNKLEAVKKSLNELSERACKLMNRNENVLVLKKYSATENIERIEQGLTTGGTGDDLKQFKRVQILLDNIQNEIKSEEMKFLEIKEENENMLEVELNKLKRFSTIGESDRYSLAEESLDELKKKNWAALAKKSLDEIKKGEQSLDEVKKKVVSFSEKFASLQKALTTRNRNLAGGQSLEPSLRGCYVPPVWRSNLQLLIANLS
ncbi:hypothetical protein SLEP1_g57502 [Rubroshorea leprosula]|nr:hypothetical protein SLEP1_g57502 [Rubroshorea leprosula]